MSIASEITRIQNNISAAYEAAEAKGATMPQAQNSANLRSTIDAIPAELTSNKVTSLSAESTDTQYPSAKCVYDMVSALSSLSFKVEEEKPTEDIKTNVIYLIPNGDSDTENIYDEWIYVNGAWELIGSTAIDLSDYYTKTDIDKMFPIIEYGKLANDTITIPLTYLDARMNTLRGRGTYFCKKNSLLFTLYIDRIYISGGGYKIMCHSNEEIGSTAYYSGSGNANDMITLYKE